MAHFLEEQLNSDQSSQIKPSLCRTAAASLSPLLELCCPKYLHITLLKQHISRMVESSNNGKVSMDEGALGYMLDPTSNGMTVS